MLCLCSRLVLDPCASRFAQIRYTICGQVGCSSWTWLVWWNKLQQRLSQSSRKSPQHRPRPQRSQQKNRQWRKSHGLR